jgi:putative thioredoxin
MQANKRENGTGSVIEVNERTFKEAVLERSRKVPVVVDFWAPWCGPCRALGPTLERLAAEAKGAFVLAKINVDENQRLSAAYQVQGIPAVKAFRDGQVVDEFTGALPESKVRAWLKRLVPSETDQIAAAAAELEASDPEAAAARYRVVLGSDPSNTAALFGLGRLLAGQGNPEGVAVLHEIQPGTPLYPQAQAWITLADLLTNADGAAQPELEQQIAATPNDLEARYRLAVQQVRDQRYDEAVAQLLELIGRARSFRDDAARRALLALFEALGPQNPVVAQGRRKLANLLF